MSEGPGRPWEQLTPEQQAWYLQQWQRPERQHTVPVADEPVAQSGPAAPNPAGQLAPPSQHLIAHGPPPSWSQKPLLSTTRVLFCVALVLAAIVPAAIAAALLSTGVGLAMVMAVPFIGAAIVLLAFAYWVFRL